MPDSRVYPGPVLGAVLLLLIAFVPTGAGVAGGFGNFGTQVIAGSGDAILPLASVSTCLAREEAGAAGVESDDNYFLHFDCASLSKSVHDILLTGTPGSIPATSVGAYTATEGASFEYLELDGKPGFSTKDWVYLDRSTAHLSVGDIRVSTPVSAITAHDSRYVSSGQTDLAGAADTNEKLLPSGTTFGTVLSLLFFDANGNNGWNAHATSGDTLVLADPLQHQTGFLQQGMVFISSSGGRTHGEHVGNGAAGTVPFMRSVTSNMVIATTTPNCSSVGLAGSDLFLHFGAPGLENFIQVGDLVLRKGGDSAGAASNFMSRVSSAALGAGTEIRDSTVATFFHIENPDSPAGFTSADWVYLNVPMCGGSTASVALSAGDLRITANNGGTSKGAGTMVISGGSGDSDLTNHAAKTADQSWQLMLDDVDESTAFPLQAMSDVKWLDTQSANSVLDDAEWVYVSSDNTVNTGDLRLRHTTLTVSTVVSATTEADFGLALTGTASTMFRVTGPDATFTTGVGEVVIYSPDEWTSVGDRAVTTVEVAPGALLTATQADGAFGASSTSDRHVLQWTGTPGQFPSSTQSVHQPYDIVLAASPTFVNADSALHVPTLSPLVTTSTALMFFDRDFSAADTLYLRVTPGNTVGASVTIRLTPYESKAAGTIVGSGDAQELFNPVTATATRDLQDILMYLENPDGISGVLDPKDHLFIDMPTELGGTNVACFGIGDIRIKAITASGTTYDPGTIVAPGNTDLTTFGCAGISATGFRLALFDENRNGAFAGDDVVYLAPSSASVPNLLSLRLNGAGGTTTTVPPPANPGNNNPPGSVTPLPSGSVTPSGSVSGSQSGSSGGNGGNGGNGGDDDDDGGDKKGFIPGPGLAILALALVAAVLVARRKL